MLKRLATFLVIFCFFFEQCGFAQVAAQAPVPAHLSGLLSSDRFHPVQLRSLSYNPSSRTFDAMVDKGDQTSLSVSQQRNAAQQLFKYFQIGLRLPNSMFWVNLRPDAQSKIIDPYLERTEMGEILLAADLQLKKDIAGLTAPNTASGRKYWDKLYSKAESLFGSGEDCEIPTVIRPWIVPGEIIIKNTPTGVFVYKASLSVMLEQDYLKNAPRFAANDSRIRELNAYSSSLIKELILPDLIRQVNSAKRYAQLRQVYHSLILAQWYKARANMIPDVSSPARKGIDSKDLTGLTAKSPWSKEKYFNAYKKSFEQGEYLLEDSVRSRSGITIRRYCSGGFSAGNIVFAPGSVVIGRDDSNLLEESKLPNLEGLSFMQEGDIKDGGNKEREKPAKLGKPVMVSDEMWAATGFSNRGNIVIADAAFNGGRTIMGIRLPIEIMTNRAERNGAQKYIIMTSFTHLDTVARVLGIDYENLKNDIIKNGYAQRERDYIVGRMDVYIYCQELGYINPDNKMLNDYFDKAVDAKKAELQNNPEALAEYKEALRKGIDSQKDKAGQTLVTDYDELIFGQSSYGHFVRNLVLSGVLGVMNERKVDIIFHSNQGIHLDLIPEGIKEDFLAKIKEAREAGKPEPVAMFLLGDTGRPDHTPQWLLGDNGGEKGGLLAKVRYSDGREVVQFVEELGVTPEVLAKINQADKDGRLPEVFSYFNTAPVFLNVKGLMKLFKLEGNYHIDLTPDEILKRVDEVSAQVPVYTSLKERQYNNRILVGYQSEPIYGDITYSAPWVPSAVDSDETVQPAAVINEPAVTNEDITKDGGTPNKMGGIDFTALPIITAPTVRSPAVPVIPVSIQELDAQWQAIVKQLNAGSVPYDSLREYVLGCRSQKLASAQLKRAHEYVNSLLRMEQDAAVPTTPQMKEVLACLAG